MEETLEDRQREHEFRVKARKAVETRKYTDRPGSDWHLNDIGTPRYCGIYQTAAIFPSPSGYDVCAYTYEGAEVAYRHFRGLDAAFRHGKKLADTEIEVDKSQPNS